jgi:hypothetical protein
MNVEPIMFKDGQVLSVVASASATIAQRWRATSADRAEVVDDAVNALSLPGARPASP